MDDLRYLTPILIRPILIFHFHITHSLDITVLVHLFICLMHTFVTTEHRTHTCRFGKSDG
jgi:hypothetical protein